jgi:hypothetical protein
MEPQSDELQSPSGFVVTGPMTVHASFTYDPKVELAIHASTTTACGRAG